MKKYIFKSFYPSFLCKKLEVILSSGDKKYIAYIYLSPFTRQFDLIDSIVVEHTNTIMFKENIKSLIEVSRRFL